MTKKISMFLILIASLLGCNQNEIKQEVAEPESLAYTLYSDKTELFVEFKPLIVGEPTKFAAHFTMLGDNFKPLTAGTITVSLIVDDKGVKQTVTAPSSPGIFRLGLEPVKAGIGTLIFDVVTKDYTDRITIDSIQVYPDIKTAIEQQAEPEAAGEISYLKEQAWKVEFANAPVTRQPFYEVIRASGQLLPAPGDEVTLVANTSGIVKFVGKNNAPGMEVRSGQPLFSISGGNVTDNNIDVAIRNARAELTKAGSDYERARELIKDRLITQSQYTDAELRYRNAQNQLNSLTRNYSSAGKSVSSSISGFIKDVMVIEGAYVEAGQPLASVGKNQRLILRADVPQQYYPKLAGISSANFRTASTGDTLFNTERLNGRLLSVGQSAAGQPLVPVSFEVTNRGKLMSGVAAEIFLQLKSDAMVISVPNTSLIEEQGIFYVYVQTAGESFQKREVKTGSTDGKVTEVLAGLKEGERVVTKGAYQIKLATSSGAVPAHGHEH
jgi:membrane fusion protein, heavy metal efflux system